MKKSNYLIIAGLLFFLPAILARLIADSQASEIIGDIIYCLFFVGVILHIIYLFIEEKRDERRK